MGLKKGHKDLQFCGKFGEASTPMAEEDWGKARLLLGGRSNGEVKRRKRCVGADAVCCVLFILPRFRHQFFTSPFGVVIVAHAI